MQGSGYLFFIVLLFSSHSQYISTSSCLFFFTNNIGAPQEDMLGRMKLLPSRSYSCIFSFFNSVGASLVPGSSSIPKSTTRERGNPGKSLGKIFENSFTMGIVYIAFSFPFMSTAQASIAHPPCCTKRLVFIINTIFGVVPVQVPLYLILCLVGGKNTTSFLWQSIFA